MPFVYQEIQSGGFTRMGLMESKLMFLVRSTRRTRTMSRQAFMTMMFLVLFV